MVSDDGPARMGVPAVAWALYDAAYSLFAFVVFARYLSDWVIEDLGLPDHYYSNTQFITALVLVVVMPMAGVLADRMGRHLPLLALFTVVSATAAVGMGLAHASASLAGILPVLVLGGVCAGATGLAIAQFDPLLAAVAPRRQWGVMSGIAVASGYLGIVIGFALFATIIVGGSGDKQGAFVPAAAIFLVLALPCLLLVREPRRPRPAHLAGVGIGTAASVGVVRAVRSLRGEPAIMRLLVGRLLYADAIGTVNIYMAVFISRVGGFSENMKNIALGVGVVCAGLGALGAGVLVRRIGPRRTLLLVLPLFACGLLITAAAGSAWSVWLLAPIIGVSLGTVYTADRVFMLAIAPTSMRGEMFGFFNLVGRVGQALGPFLLWGGVIWLLHERWGWLTRLEASRVSLALLAITAVVGMLVIRPLDDRHARMQ